MSNNSESLDYTAQSAYKAAVVIWKVVPPILILLGTIGNSLSIYVLTRRSIRVSTTAFYLTVLAFSDLIVLYSGLLRQWLVYLFDIDVRHVSPAGCKINIWLVYSSLDFSAWILIVVTLERVVSAWLPHNAKTICTKQSALAFLITIAVFILALNAHLMYGMVFQDVYDVRGNIAGVNKCSEINPDYYEFFNKTWPWIDLCAFCVIPFAVIVIGNSLILFKVLHSQKKTKSIAPSSSVPSSARRGNAHGQNRHSSMTAVLVTLNMVFLLTTSPISVYNIGYTYWVTGATNKKIAELDFWWAFVNMLMYTNNSLNFLLYCLSGTKFRREVIRLFCRKINSGQNDRGPVSKYTRTRFDISSREGSQVAISANNSPNLSRLNNQPSTSNDMPVQIENGHKDMVYPLNTLHPNMALCSRQHMTNSDDSFASSLA